MKLETGQVFSIRIPNPFFEEGTNVFVLPGPPVTLIDTGIGTDQSLLILQQGLREHGLELVDVERILLTHKHPDHMGLAARIQRLAGSEVWVHEDEAEDVESFEEKRREHHQKFKSFLSGCGTPEGMILPMLKALETAGELAQSVPVRSFRDGMTFGVGDRQMRVLHTPGHTQGSCCFQLDGLLFAGDTVLPDYTPNVGTGEFRHAGMLRKFIESLTSIIGLGGEEMRVYPGHGAALDRPRDRIQANLAHHHRRADRLEELLRTDGPMTVFELSRRLFGTVEGFHVALAVGETDAHLEWLYEEGRIGREGRLFTP